MQIRYFAWFETKHEKTEFIKMLNSCHSDIEAIRLLMDKYPNFDMAQIRGIVDNFKNEINKP